MPEAKTCGRVEGTVCEDRFRELPEDLIVRILGLLPTKDAVVTMFLSKRWHFVWTKVLELKYKDSDLDSVDDNLGSEDDDDYDDDDDDDYDDDDEEEDEEVYNELESEDESKKSVWWFLDKTLQLHNAPVIHKLSMKLGRRCPTDVDVGKWVANAIERCVRELKFKLLWSAAPITVTKTLYSCKSLVSLTLSHKILVDVPFTACLPSLEELHLNCVVYKDEDSHVRFLSACPVLKILEVTRKKDDNVKKFNVNVPCLLSLTYDNNYTRKDVQDTGGCLIINTPSLEKLIILDSSRDCCSTEDIPCLADAYIDIISYPDDRLFKSLSSVLSLELNLTDEMLRRFSTINYTRLECLKIIPVKKSDWLEPLMLLLGNTSKLKSLLVNYETTVKPEHLPLSWNKPSSVPGCLSSQLEIFEWREYGGRVEEEQFFKYILASSKCLKTVKISMRPNLEEQHLIMEKKLKDIHRASSTSSQLSFFFK